MPDLRLLHFTPVELAFLARATDTDAGRITSTKLLLGDEACDAVIASGYGSLRLRGWTTVLGDHLELDPALEGIAGVFGTASQWTQLSFLNGDEASSVLLVRGEALAVVLRPLETGVIDIAAIDAGADTGSVSKELIVGFLASANPDTVSVEMECEGFSRLAAARSTQGHWSFQVAVSGGAGDTQREDGLTADQVAAKFTEWLVASSRQAFSA